MQKSPIEIIRSSAAHCRSKLLDRVIFHDQAGVIHNFMCAVTLDGKGPVWMDIPIDAIVGLHHLNFTKNGATWRESLSGLRGTDWSPKVFHYFTSEIRDQNFPAIEARRTLHLRCYSGAVTSINGAHRLTGAIAWLCSNQSDSSVLLKVRTSYHIGRERILDKIISISRESQSLEVAQIPKIEYQETSKSPVDFLLRSKSPKGAIQVFEIITQEDSLIPVYTPIFKKIFRIQTKDYIHLEWDTLPKTLIHAWEHRDWLKKAIEHAEECPANDI